MKDAFTRARRTNILKHIIAPFHRILVSKLFDVCSKSTPEQMEKLEEIRIPWGSGIVGYVAESGEPVNIPDAYKVRRYLIKPLKRMKPHNDTAYPPTLASNVRGH